MINLKVRNDKVPQIAIICVVFKHWRKTFLVDNVVRDDFQQLRFFSDMHYCPVKVSNNVPEMLLQSILRECTAKFGTVFAVKFKIT